LGIGSTFSFELVFANAVSDAHRPIKASLNRVAISSVKRVLLVDDNQVNLVVGKKFLETWSIEVVVAHHGAEAIERVQDKSFDLILMDLHMPVMDGFQAATAIRNFPDDYFKQLPIIAVTADVSSEVMDKIYAAGMNGLLTKPLRQDELTEILQDVDVRSVTSNTNHPFPKLAAVSEGDKAFEKELVSHLMTNLKELGVAVENAVLHNALDAFSTANHKCKTSLGLVEDRELDRVIREIDGAIKANRPLAKSWIAEFNQASENLIQKLKMLVKD
jgi:CheY-like chemotaxis protein